MKIASIYCGTIKSSWNDSDGIGATLNKMGHTVVDVPMWRPNAPSISAEDLRACDLVLGSGLEHLAKEPNVLKVWQSLKVPKFALYHESFFRDDVTIDFHALKGLAEEHFFPAAQDAKMFNGANFGVKGHCHWLPFGVDTEIFKKAECSVCHGTSSPLEYIPCGRCRGEGAEGEPEDRDIALGFVGSMYPKRAHYVKALSNHLKGIPLIGSVIVEDIDGVQYRETAERLATNYRRIKIFLNLPSESRLLVSKVYEVMACGTFLMTPGLNQDAQENMGQFVDGRDIVFYKPSNLPYLAQMINEFVSNDAKRDAIAAAGYKEVRENHSLVKRMEKVLEVMK